MHFSLFFQYVAPPTKLQRLTNVNDAGLYVGISRHLGLPLLSTCQSFRRGTGQAEMAKLMQSRKHLSPQWGFLQEHPESKLSLEEVFVIKALDSAMRASQSLVGRNGTREGLRSPPLGVSLGSVR